MSVEESNKGTSKTGIAGMKSMKRNMAERKKPEIQEDQHVKFPLSFVRSWGQGKRLGEGYEMICPKRDLLFF